jgi:hypothetical protein
MDSTELLERGIAVESPPHRSRSRIEAGGRSASQEGSDAPRSLAELQCSLRGLERLLARGGRARERRLVERAIEIAASLSARVVEGPVSPPRSDGSGWTPLPRLWIASHARWFEVEGGARVDLTRRSALRGVLLALATAEPKASLDCGALTSAGWPEERVLARAAELRVRTAIKTLRHLGLRGVLVTTGDGYRLEARVLLEPGQWQDGSRNVAGAENCASFE